MNELLKIKKVIGKYVRVGWINKCVQKCNKTKIKIFL